MIVSGLSGTTAQRHGSVEADDLDATTLEALLLDE